MSKRQQLIQTAFDTPTEVHAYVSGLWASLKRPHRYPSAPDKFSDERPYWRAGGLTAKAVLAVSVMVVAYTRIGGF